MIIIILLSFLLLLPPIYINTLYRDDFFLLSRGGLLLLSFFFYTQRDVWGRYLYYCLKILYSHRIICVCPHLSNEHANSTRKFPLFVYIYISYIIYTIIILLYIHLPETRYTTTATQNAISCSETILNIYIILYRVRKRSGRLHTRLSYDIVLYYIHNNIIQYYIPPPRVATVVIYGGNRSIVCYYNIKYYI